MLVKFTTTCPFLTPVPMTVTASPVSTMCSLPRSSTNRRLVDRGAFTWATGRWQTVAIRVKLNDVGQANGEQELIVDGESKINISGVTFATEAGTKIYGIMAQTFFVS